MCCTRERGAPIQGARKYAGCAPSDPWLMEAWRLFPNGVSFRGLHGRRVRFIPGREDHPSGRRSEFELTLRVRRQGGCGHRPPSRVHLPHPNHGAGVLSDLLPAHTPVAYKGEPLQDVGQLHLLLRSDIQEGQTALVAELPLAQHVQLGADRGAACDLGGQGERAGRRGELEDGRGTSARLKGCPAGTLWELHPVTNIRFAPKPAQ